MSEVDKLLKPQIPHKNPLAEKSSRASRLRPFWRLRRPTGTFLPERCSDGGLLAVETHSHGCVWPSSCDFEMTAVTCCKDLKKGQFEWTIHSLPWAAAWKHLQRAMCRDASRLRRNKTRNQQRVKHRVKQEPRSADTRILSNDWCLVRLQDYLSIYLSIDLSIYILMNTRNKRGTQRKTHIFVKSQWKSCLNDAASNKLLDPNAGTKLPHEDHPNQPQSSWFHTACHNVYILIYI